MAITTPKTEKKARVAKPMTPEAAAILANGKAALKAARFAAKIVNSAKGLSEQQIDEVIVALEKCRPSNSATQ